MIDFNVYISSRGNAGNSRLGVHLIITSLPKMASFASFWHSVPAELSVLSFVFSSRTSLTSRSVCFAISDEGRTTLTLEGSDTRHNQGQRRQTRSAERVAAGEERDAERQKKFAGRGVVVERTR